MRKKNLGINKKRSSKKFGDIWPKNNDFKHISEIYRLEQPFFRSRKAKKLVFRSINAKKFVIRSNFLFFRSKKSKK